MNVRGQARLPALPASPIHDSACKAPPTGFAKRQRLRYIIAKCPYGHTTICSNPIVWSPAMRNLIPLFIIAITCCLSAPSQAAAYVWWEGENAAETNFPDDTWFGNGGIAETSHLLSGGAWLCNAGTRTGEAAFARYSIDIPEAGTYEFWVRKFWKHGPFRWRFGDQDWRVVGSEIALADNVSLNTHLGANWVYAGEVTLPAGNTVFELRLLAAEGESLTACFDAFLLTQMPFIPRGKLKPDEKSGLADEGFFSWEPGMDAFTDEALLDLRSLNEDVAGQNGFVRKEGSQFVLGDGTPVRFWAVGVNSEIAAMNRASIDYMAKNLAKRGVNMVRYHSSLYSDDDVDQVDREKLDNLHYLVHSMKQEGIYTKISFYFPLWFDIQPQYGIAGFDNDEYTYPFSLIFFEERMQEIYTAWLDQLLSIESPYSGAPLAEEPAVAIIEVLNEDSLFFWNFGQDDIPPRYWEELEGLFADWLIEQYGSLEAAAEAWGEESVSQTQNRVPVYEAWHMTGSGLEHADEARIKRIGDQVQFLTEMQRGFYETMTDRIKNQLGARSLVSASNWRTSDPNMLGALERYTYMAGDVIDKHGYYDREHSSDDGSHAYSVRAGHDFENVSASQNPAGLPWQWIQITDYPHIISETNITNPNLYRADFNFLLAAYGSLQGVDGVFPFALGGPFWDTSMEKFAVSCPTILGGFPAYALMYRRGDVQEAETVIHQILDLDDLYAMKGNGGSEAQALDKFREADIPAGESAEGEVGSIDPLSFYAGKVTREFGGNTEDSFERNLEGYIFRDEERVISLTEELNWDYGEGVVQVNTPACQGMAGFVSRHVFESDVLRIEMNNEYGSIVVIALDDQPIAS